MIGPHQTEAELREEITRLMNLQTIDRQLHELGQSLASIAERVEQLRGETETAQTELERLTEEDQQAVPRAAISNANSPRARRRSATSGCA